MRLLLRAESCALLLALAACSSKVDSTNPYDPGTPVGQKAKARVHGRILAPTLAPPIAVQVTLSTNNVPFGQQVTAADGSFVFSDLPPGAYALQASPQGFVPLLLPLTLQPGDDIDLKDVALTVVTGPSLGTLSGKATLGTTATDNSGIFVETVVAAGAAFSTQTNPSGDWSLSVAPGSYTLRFSHKNFKPTTTTQPVVVAQGAAAQVPPVALAYDPATVSGAVDGELAAGGTAPLTDATVTLDSTGVTGVSGGAGPAAGTFALTGIPAGSYVLRAIKAGYLADTQPVLELAGHEVRALATHLVLKLARGGIAGSVQLAGSADASGVTVQLSGGGSGSAITGPDGKYSFNGLLTGVYTVTASRPGYQTLVLGAAVTVTVGAVASPGAGTLQPNPATLLGHVDAENAAGGTDPLQNAAISLDGVPGATTLSNVGGDFALPVPVGSYVVRVHLAGYQDDTQPALNLSGGEQRTLPNPFRLSLLRGSIAGTVLLSGRADASGIAVTFRNASFSFTTLTGASGAFTSGSIPVGSYTVDATRAPDWQPISVAAVAVARNAVAALPGSPVTLQPLATATLGGTALLELQANASGTTVSLTGTDFRGVAVNATGTTSNAGVFSFGSLLAGGYQIAFSQGGFDSPPPVGVSVVTGQAANVGTLTLLASRGSASGSVTATGAADQSGTVVNVSGGPDSASTVTDSAGNFRIDRLRVGNGYAAAFTRGAYAKVTSAPFAVASAAVTAVPPATLTLATGGSIAGAALVARPAGANGGIAVSLTGVDVNGAAVTRATSTAASGAWSVAALPAGTYALSFSKASYDPQQLSGIVVGAGAVNAASVTLPVSAGTIAGSVALAAGGIAGFNVGTDFSGVVVTLTGTDVPVPSTVTDASGKYQFGGVPVSLAGTQFTVGASKPYFTSATTSVTGAANTTVTVAQTLTLPVSAGSLGGTAVLYDNTSHDGHTPNATSAGVAIGVTGTAFNGSSFSAGGVTVASGAWTLGSLPPGSYQAIATNANRSCAAYPSATVPASASGSAGSIQCVDALAPGALVLGAPVVPAGAQPGFTTATGISVPIATPASDATAPASNFQGYQLAIADAANLNGAAIVAGQPASLSFTGLAANARNVLWVRGIDWVGNPGPATSVVVTTDTLAPPTPGIITPRTIVNATTTSVTIAGSESDANFAGYQSCTSTHLATFTCAAAADCAFAPGPASFAVSLVANQKTCLYAQGLDRAGNVSGTAMVSVISDLLPPSPPAFSPSYDPFKMSVRTPFVDFFSTGAATDLPGPGGPWQGIAWIEVDTGSGFQPLCPQSACSAGGAWNPCACSCADTRLRCDGTTFVGVRASLTEGTSTTVAFRAVDLAGNTGAGVSQQVLSDATGDVISAVTGQSLYQTVHGTLVGYETSAPANQQGWLLDLGPNRRVGPTNVRCVLTNQISVSLSHSVVPISAGLVTFTDGNNLYIDRPGPDGLWCTADDVKTGLYTAPVYGSPPANTRFEGIVGSGEKLLWGQRDLGTQRYSLVVAEPPAGGKVGTAADARIPIATYDQLNEINMGGRAMTALIANCGPTCYTFFWRVFNANAAGSFGSGVTTFDVTTMASPGNGGALALSSDGLELAYVEPGSVIVLRRPGPDGLYGTADDVIVKTTSPWPLGAQLSVDGPNIVVLVYGTPNYLVHWSAGPDGVWGTADDVVERTHPSSAARQVPSLSDGLLTFESGRDILDVDLSAFRWEVAPTLSLNQSSAPLSANGIGTLFYMTGYGNQFLVARTSAGTETSIPTLASDYATDRTQVVVAEQSAPAGLYVYKPDAAGLYFTAGTTPVSLYPTNNYLTYLSLGAGKAISVETATVAAATCGGYTYCGIYKIFDPGAGPLGPGTVAFNPYPGAPGTLGESGNYISRPAINARQAFFHCGAGVINTCVYGAGPDGRFGTADDVPSSNLKHPGTGTLYSQADLVVNGTRMLITEPFPAGLYLLDAGPDGLFNTADDVERKLANIYAAGSLGLAGNWATYLDQGGAGGQQAYLVSGFDGTPYLLSSHYSTKRAPIVDPAGRAYWIDGIFMPEGIMLRAP